MTRPLSYLEIDKAALRSNVAAFRARIASSSALIAVVKGNAYGHGLEQVVLAIDDLVDGFQVDDIEELRAIRKLTERRVLALGYLQPDDLEEAVRLGGELALYDCERLELLAKMPNAKAHLKVDVLLGRQGVLPDGVAEMASLWRSQKSPELVGLYTHFSNLEDTPNRSHAEAQIEGLRSAQKQVLDATGADVPCHIASTAGILAYEGQQSQSSLVRLGIGLYGLHPSPNDQEKIQLQPALRWGSHLAQVKTLPAGHPVGYGLTYVTWKPTKIGIVPQGYSDGYDRALSNKGKVLVGGKRCQVLGRVAMNMIAVDLSQAPEAQAMDEVVLLGSQGTDRISAEAVADWTDTINYEVVTRISPLLPRLLV